MLNAMNLDATRIGEYREETWNFVRHLAAERAKTPDIPLILFLHIPLSKPAGVCESNPQTRHKDGFVAYQDYLSPAASAFILRCLKPTFIFNGHDHHGCLAIHSVQEGSDLSNYPSSLATHLRPGKDICELSVEELDAHSSEIDAFAKSTMSVVNGSVAATNSSWTTIEITVRSAMGDYGGVAGIFDISRSSSVAAQEGDGTSSPARDIGSKRLLSAVSRREMTASADGYRYQYREVALGHHLAVRILAIADLVSMLVLPLIWIL
ncbi:hypothetical protein LPJ56_004723 [Coemansia sp. RSA 2599]|nr:hypothetical protein LPJ75_004601 [Coemansia sp. RSA 2598]KAJ1814898.1 hypothetical protein LPJ56_004723 [Coemansia sp. RSA 2599]